MLFNSLPFAAFAVLVFLLYYFPPLKRYQLPLLVAASAVFYAWTAPALLILLAVSVSINALTSYRVAFTEPKVAWRWALAGVVSNLSILAFFKYGTLLATTFQKIALGSTESVISIPLPIGISFYTFEGISLLVDTLRQRRSDKPSFAIEPGFGKHFGRTALFIVFFPHLIAGPILKARHFFPQISEKHFRDIPWADAARCLLVGFFLKTVCADNLKDYTFWISYPAYESLSSATALALLFGYSIQIFADFAGYSLIAIGLAKLFGYELPQNFNFPYLSKSLSEFWRRWHISLSTWLRDYLYIPLGGNRKGEARTYLHLFVVMALGGMWHGAAWSYAVWGIYHGTGLALERLLFGKRLDQDETAAPSLRRSIAHWLRIGFVFSFVTLGWLLFKLPNFSEALGFLRVIWTNRGMGVDVTRVFPVMVYSLPVILYYAWNTPRVIAWRTSDNQRLVRRAVLVESAAFALVLFGLLVNGGGVSEFIYFQF